MQRIHGFFSAWRYRSVRDAVTVAAICVAIYAASNWFELPDRTYAFAQAYKAYHVDDLIVVAIAFWLPDADLFPAARAGFEGGNQLAARS